MSLNLPSPDDLSMLTYYQQRVVQDLAKHIACTAVEDKAAVPDCVLAAYHDALKLESMIESMYKDAKDDAMYSLMSR